MLAKDENPLLQEENYEKEKRMIFLKEPEQNQLAVEGNKCIHENAFLH